MPPMSPPPESASAAVGTPAHRGLGDHRPDGVRISGGDTATPLNLAKRVALIETLAGLRGRRVLDAGCGAGEYVEAFVARGADAVGIEFSAEKVRAYRARHPDSPRVTRGELTAVPLPDGRFDLVLLNEVLEHTPDETGTLAEMRRLLKPDGVLVVFSPNRLFPFETHGVSLRGSGRALSPWVPGLPYLPRALGRRWFTAWARNYGPRELPRLLAAAGFRVTRRAWVWQTFENISGRQPRWIARAAPLLRRVAGVLEACPGLRCFGASQVLVAAKA